MCLIFFRNLFPPNIIEATMFQDRTQLTPPKNATADLPPELYDITTGNVQTTNVLGIVMFAVVLGTTIGKMQEKGKPLQQFFTSMSEAMMIITRWVIWLDIFWWIS